MTHRTKQNPLSSQQLKGCRGRKDVQPESRAGPRGDSVSKLGPALRSLQGRADTRRDTGAVDLGPK